MKSLPGNALHLTSEWFIVPGKEQEVHHAIPHLVAQVRATEPDTLAYMVHHPRADSASLQSLPPADRNSLLFFEIYRNEAAFEQHLQGKAFNDFVSQHGDLFIQSNGKPFTFVEFLHMEGGFIRDGATLHADASHAAVPAPANRHPAIMFEVLATDKAKLKQFYTSVFDWHYDDPAPGGFAYVKFPVQFRALLGGIGQASTEPGFEPGNHFYLQVEDVQQAIAKAVASGGSEYLPVTRIDGYTFAMVKDPEGNIIGLIKSAIPEPD